MSRRPIVDTHNDLLLEVDHHRQEPDAFARRWLPQLRRGGVLLQVCPVYAGEPDWVGTALPRVLRQATAFQRAIADNPGDVVAVASSADVGSIGPDQIGLLLSMEGVEALGEDPWLFDTFWQLGVRMVSLTHNRRNPFADGLGESDDRGLTALGRELVGRLVERGCMIDLAHASPRTFADVLELSELTQVLVSHAGCRAVHDSPRNLDDGQLRAIAERGGVIGIMALPFATDPARPTIDRVVDHIEHALEVAGPEHVGLGADFFAQVAAEVPNFGEADGGWEIEGLGGPAGYPLLIDALERRGLPAEIVGAVAGSNMLRLFRGGLPG
jgi:membrane dipeptidase